jgi:hypothetical protein
MRVGDGCRERVTHYAREETWRLRLQPLQPLRKPLLRLGFQVAGA